jgi:hypothetical protein
MTILDVLQLQVEALHDENHEAKHLEYSIHLLKKGYPVDHEFEYEDIYDPMWYNIPDYKELQQQKLMENIAHKNGNFIQIDSMNKIAKQIRIPKEPY